MDVGPGSLNPIDMFDDHARDRPVEAAAPDIGLGKVAGDIEARGPAPAPGQRQLAGIDVVVDEVDAVSGGLFLGEQRVTPAADLADAAQVELMRQPEDGRLVVIPRLLGMPAGPDPVEEAGERTCRSRHRPTVRRGACDRETCHGHVRLRLRLRMRSFELTLAA